MEDPWQAAYTQSAIDFIMQHVSSERVARKLFEYRDLLEQFPDLGAPYQPDYPAAIPPFPCRCIAVPDTPFSLYYLKQEDRRRIVVFCVEFQRQDPNARFSSLDWAVVPW